jgi:hypothetical protein
MDHVVTVNDELDDDYPGGWFGASWGAPVCNPARHLATPVGDQCPRCPELIQANDQGMLIPHVLEDSGPSLIAYHLTCFHSMVLPLGE